MGLGIFPMQLLANDLKTNTQTMGKMLVFLYNILNPYIKPRKEDATIKQKNTPAVRCHLEIQLLSRKDAYRWMQDIFCLPSSQAHIGQFSDYRCDHLKDECRRVLQNNHVKVTC